MQKFFESSFKIDLSLDLEQLRNLRDQDLKDARDLRDQRSETDREMDICNSRVAFVTENQNLKRCC